MEDRIGDAAPRTSIGSIISFAASCLLVIVMLTLMAEGTQKVLARVRAEITPKVSTPTAVLKLPEPAAQARICAAERDACIGGFVRWRTGRITRIARNCVASTCELRDDTPVSRVTKDWAAGNPDPNVLQIILRRDAIYWQLASLEYALR